MIIRITKKTWANFRRRMNFNPGEHARRLHEQPRHEMKAHTPQPVRQPVGYHHLETGIKKYRRQLVAGRWIALNNRIKIASQIYKH